MEQRRRPAKRVTIKDVAQACGVALSTVSNALSGKGYVRADTRDLIVATAQELGFQASPTGRGFRLGRSWSVGLLLADIANPWFPELVRGVEDVLWSAGMNLVLCNTDYKPEKVERYLTHLVDRRVDGIILASVAEKGTAVPGLMADGVPVVMLNRRHESAATDYVGMDNAGGTALAVRHLQDLGHRRIAFIAGRQGSSAAAERLQGFQAAMRLSGTSRAAGIVAHGDYSIQSGLAAATTLLSAPERPTAIVSANDFMAYGALQAAMQLDLAVPRDLSVIGFDDIFVSSLPFVGLTTVKPQTWQLGARSAELMLRRITDPNQPPEDSILQTELVIRSTTGPVGDR